MEWKGEATTWQHYYDEAAQRKDYLAAKKNMTRDWLELVPGLNTLADTGANEGEFSQLAAARNVGVIATDFDHGAVNNLYRRIKLEKIKSVQPLLIDLANPSPAGGLNQAERSSFLQRVNVDCCLALALVHHLAIGHNIPFEKIAEMYAAITRYLLIEFIPKEDPKVQLMLQDKKDIYSAYTEDQFTRAFGQFFSLVKREEVGSSGRVLYLFKK
jgi:ribosomal protein L11 methylase PrmA